MTASNLCNQPHGVPTKPTQERVYMLDELCESDGDCAPPLEEVLDQLQPGLDLLHLLRLHHDADLRREDDWQEEGIYK